jgi:outer membrane protein OmpA-like peptidoglycan-associated protein
MFRRTLLCLAPLCLLSSLATAQTLRPDDIVNQLAPKRPLTRSLAVGAPKPVSRAIVVEAGREAEIIKEKADLPKVNIRVPFEYNSAVLTPEGRGMLQTLAVALKDQRLQGLRFLVGGHTDATGTDVYNQDLSERRAKAVRDHLVASFQIAPERLQTIGFGKRELVDPKDPAGAANRRVEIVTLP